MSRYATENIVFFDFESRCKVPIKLGSYRYAIEADATILTWAQGLGPVQIIEKGGKALSWNDFPADLQAAFHNPNKTFCAYNAGFDRCVWNYSLLDSPWMAPGKVIDARATALAHNLPDGLENVSKRLGGPGKQKDGKALKGMFCGEGAIVAADNPEAWDRFCSYAKQDTEELRRVFRIMLPALTDYDWAAYHANEQVNDNGAGVDVKFCQEAARLAAEESARIGGRLAELTGGRVTSVSQNVELAKYVHDRLPDAEARLIMSTVYKDEADAEDDETLVEKVKLTIARGTVERLLDYLRKIGSNDTTLLEILELREFGASAAPKKFQAILDREIDGRVHGEFTFGGAGMTGRFSGKGVQLQNLTRGTLAANKSDDYAYWEEPTVALIAGGCTLEELAAHGNGEVSARKLALTIRPAFCARAGRTLVKADYKQVEARMLPWLAKSKGGDKLLDSFRASDANPDAPDLYEVTAGGMAGKSGLEVSKEERQTGKVATLACGFGGGRNALHAMGALYRMHFTDAEAQAIVDAWRKANPWAPAFWGKHNREESYGLFGAARQALDNPHMPVPCGRVTFVAMRTGTLLCILPSGRPLIYPSCRMRDYDITDKVSKKVLETRHGLTFRRARGVIALYGGRFAENVTQAAAADLLRESIVTLVNGGHKVVSHSHDEIVIDCAVEEVDATKAAMEAAMLAERGWADGLPLAVDIAAKWYYSAAKQPGER